MADYFRKKARLIKNRSFFIDFGRRFDMITYNTDFLVKNISGLKTACRGDRKYGTA